MVPQVNCSPARQCWIRAFERATSEKLIPYRVSPGVWNVKVYTVRVTGHGWSDLVCDCPAGRSGKICMHAAVTAAAISRGLSPIRSTTPAPAPTKSAHDLLMECYQ